MRLDRRGRSLHWRGCRLLSGVETGDAIGERGKGISDRRMRPALEGRSEAIAEIGRLRWRRRSNEGGIRGIVESGDAVRQRGEGIAGWRLRPALNSCAEARTDVLELVGVEIVVK